MHQGTPPHVRLQHLLRSLPHKQGADRAERLLEISELHGFMGEYDEAHAAAAAAYEIAVEIDSHNLQALSLAARAKAARHRGTFEEALIDDVSAAELFAQLAEWDKAVHCRLDASDSAYALEMFNEALHQAQLALANAEGLFDDELVGRSSLRAAQACLKLEQHGQVLQHANRARALLNSEAKTQSLICDLIADAHLGLDDPNSALHYLEQSMVIMQAVYHGAPPLWERWHYAKGLREAGRLHEAHEMLTENIELLQGEDANLQALGNCHLELAQVLYEMGEVDEARDRLRVASLFLEVSGSSAALDDCGRLNEEWAA